MCVVYSKSLLFCQNSILLFNVGVNSLEMHWLQRHSENDRIFVLLFAADLFLSLVSFSPTLDPAMLTDL